MKKITTLIIATIFSVVGFAQTDIATARTQGVGATVTGGGVHVIGGGVGATVTGGGVQVATGICTHVVWPAFADHPVGQFSQMPVYTFLTWFAGQI